MRRALTICIASLFLLTVTVGLTEARQASSKKAKQARRPATESKVQTPETCKAFAVMEASTGKVLESQELHAKLPPASITKLMVALIVLEKVTRKELQLSDQVAVSKAASKIGGSQVYLKEGESFPLEEMMKAMMIASANDAAYAIAEHVAGSSDAFVTLMNEKAKALNMADSEFHSPHGLPPAKDQKEDIVSPNDLLLLSRELLKYPKLLEWTSSKTDSFRGETFTLTNTNKLLVKMPEVDGLKTGFYRQAGFSIVATAKRGDLRFVAAVMACPTGKYRDQFAMEKLKAQFSQYKVIPIVKKGEVIDKDVNLVDGKFKKIKGVAGAGFSYAMPQSKKGNIRKEISIPESIKGEVREGQKLGEVIVYVENDQVGKIDIVSPTYVPKANLFTRLIRRLGLNI